MVTELCSGPCIALEIRQLDPQKVFRDFCGPSDPVSYLFKEKYLKGDILYVKLKHYSIALLLYVFYHFL